MGDKDKDNYIDFREFLNYCVEHEKKLWLVFQAMDVNKDGRHNVSVVVLRAISTSNVVIGGHIKAEKAEREREREHNNNGGHINVYKTTPEMWTPR